jgi:uncharacterized repeat protein (TIGR03806 family)
MWTVAAGAQPYGLTNRVATATLKMPSSAPVFGYRLTNIFDNIAFDQPLGFAVPPGETNRLFVLEKRGTIVVITNLANPTRSVFMKLAITTVADDGLLGMAFHPGYATNHYFYTFFTRNQTSSQGDGRHMVLARFETSPSDPNAALTNSELPLISQYDAYNYHHAGDLHFGPDGYLYVALGDGGPQRDGDNHSQTITNDFFSGLLRLDVDRRPGNLLPNPHPANTTNYFVPSDNPFVGVTNFDGVTINPADVRTEFYAVGLRVPWRFSFDEPTGRLYLGDVGQDAYEEVDIITKGSNYGWAYREGLHPGPKTAPEGFTSIDPILEYDHGTATNQGNSITGGIVYRGARIPNLAGWYVFADYISGNVWRLLYNGTNVVNWERIASSAGLVSFAADPSNGDVLMANVDENTIKRLVYNSISDDLLPPTLADTGVFTNISTLTPNPGFVPYDVNVPLWSDSAWKQRWVSVPLTEQLTFNPTNYWTFPTGAVWVKHFELELTNGVPESRRRLETRLLVRDSTSSGVYGVTYRWDDSQTNAVLVPDQGMDETFSITDGDNVRTQVWHYPSRSECLLCHTLQAVGVLGFNAPQLNRDFNYDGITDNQLRALSNAGYFTAPLTNRYSLLALAPATNESASVEFRARSYLMANCSHCHQPGGSAPGTFDARIWTPLSAAGLVGGALFNDAGDRDNRVIVPGSLSNSMLHTRLSVRGSGQMPPLASSVLDTQAIALVRRWITNDLSGYVSFATWQSNYFGSTNSAQALEGADPDADGAVNRLEWLTGTDPTNSLDVWRVSVLLSNDTVAITFPRLANRGFEVQWAPSLSDARFWQFLDVPANGPFFSVASGQSVVLDTLTNSSAKYYRVRVYEP